MKKPVDKRERYVFNPFARNAHLHINGHHLEERIVIPARIMRAFVQSRSDLLQKIKAM